MANASRNAQMLQLAQARQGDEAALAGIIARMMPVLNAAAARAACPGLEFEATGRYLPCTCAAPCRTFDTIVQTEMCIRDSFQKRGYPHCRDKLQTTF